MSAEAPETPNYSLRVPVPRDPAEYSPSTHFKQRKKYRTPEIKGWIVEELLAEGECKQVDADRFFFEKTVWSEGQHDWRLVVAVVDEAFTDPETKHRILTAFCTCCPKEDDRI